MSQRYSDWVCMAMVVHLVAVWHYVCFIYRTHVIIAMILVAVLKLF